MFQYRAAPSLTSLWTKVRESSGSALNSRCLSPPHDDELTMVVKKGTSGDGAGEPATTSQATSAAAVVNATSATRARRVRERRVGSMRFAMMVSSVV